MSSIALFPCTSTEGTEIAKSLSEKLELRIYTDEDLIADTAVAFNCKPETLEEMMYARTSVFNQFTLEKEKTINMLRSILADKLVTADNFLFYGHHAVLIPLNITEVLTVLVVDKKKNRIARAVKNGLSEKEGQKLIKHDDLSAYRWTDFIFKKEAFDSSLYDVVIPRGQDTDEKIVDSIISYFRKTSVLRSTESQKAVRDMKLAALVEKSLLSRGHVLDVQVDGGNVNLTVQKSVINFDGLKNDLTHIALEVEGVQHVTVHRSPEYSDSIYRQQIFELPSKVLFVDDEQEFVQTVAQRLISRNVGTYGVYNGADALDLISVDRPDVMVLDLKMPGMHGVDVLKKTKELNPEIEIIILTGHGSVEDEKECMGLGAFAYMNKPVDIEELSKTITAAHAKFTENTHIA